ncbi:MAG: beta-N-acetylglucosaminidase domain-containing protein, partial [Vicinamibacteria bacterium]
VMEHLRFCADLGFNAVWVDSGGTGRWTTDGASHGPSLSPAFLDLAAWCRERNWRIFVAVHPLADSGNRLAFHEGEAERRIRKLIRLLRRRAGVRDFVLSFENQPTELIEPGDVVRYGRSSAPAHLDLTRRIARSVGSKVGLWLCAAAYCDAHLGDGQGDYSKPFLEGLPLLPAGIGIVWTGPSVFAPSITAGDLTAARARLGGRELLLRDNYPYNDDVGQDDTLALRLGPLRRRDAALARIVSVYMVCPMAELGASRLPLLTIADYLSDPERYDPDASLRRAMRRLAGEDPAALAAIETQAIEWGGWIGERNYRLRDSLNPKTVASALDDPAAVASWTWTEKRYGDRMAALSRVEDVFFRDDVLEVMARKLAIARAIPLVVEALARSRAGRKDVAPILDALRQQRRLASVRPGALRALDLFLGAAGFAVSDGALSFPNSPA